MDREIYKKLIDSIKDKEYIVKEIFIFYNNVVVVSKNVGVAGTCKTLPQHSEKRKLYPALSDFKGKTVAYLFNSLIDTENILERSVLLAAINSCIDYPKDHIMENSISLGMKNINKRDSISFIGHFPAADKLKKEGYNVNIIELEPKPGDIYYYDSDEILKQTDILFITGLTIINGTFSEIIEKTKKECIKVLMGPSVPFSKTLHDLGVDIVGSSIIKDYEKMLKFWQYGGAGMRRAPKGALKVVSLVKDQML